jgi:uncharacterized YccA/Bax inhibitor family protein
MALFKSGNPALDKETFHSLPAVKDSAQAMTIQGTVNKTALLLVLVFASALYPWQYYSEHHNSGTLIPQLQICIIAALFIGFWIAHNKDHSGYLAPVYAVLEGFALGLISAMYEELFPGIIFDAVIITFSIATCLLAIYKLEWIKPTQNFALIVGSAVSGIALYYLIVFLLQFFGIHTPHLAEYEEIGIIISIYVIAMASATLVADFDFIEDGVNRRCPKYMEWYSAFGLMVTIIWLYLEILRLLAKLRRR